MIVFDSYTLTSRGPGRMVVGFTIIFMQSMPITTKIMSYNPAHGKVYSMQRYVIQFVSDLRQVSGFLLVPCK
jgi:hypothetical protein